MLDYTFNLKKKKVEEFIRFYEVKDGKIYIHTNKGIIIKDYSKTLEINILDNMKKQLEKWKRKIQNDKDSTNRNTFSNTFSLLGLANIFLGLKVFIPTENHIRIINLVNLITGVLLILSNGKDSLNTHKISKIYEDYVKNLLFIENQDLINENLKQFLISEGLVDENATIAVPLYEVYANINDAHFLNEDEVQDLIDGNINGEMVLRLYKNSK